MNAQPDAAYSSGGNSKGRDGGTRTLCSAAGDGSGVPTNRVTSIVHEARALTADTALRLARYFGTSPEFWLNLAVSV